MLKKRGLGVLGDLGFRGLGWVKEVNSSYQNRDL